MIPDDLTNIILDFSESRDTDWFIDEILSHIDNSSEIQKTYLEGGLTIPFHSLAIRREFILKEAFSDYDFDHTELSSLDEVLEVMLEKI